MPGVKSYIFSVQDLYDLLVHYTDGQVPLNGEVKHVLQNERMTQKMGMVVASPEWQTNEILFLGYDGKRNMSWARGCGEKEIKWEQKNDTPARQ
jgi:hypothetical protein